jgi:hypothetical protein
MKRLLITSVIFGIIAGLLVGGFYNLFQVPVMERAIALEEERAASVTRGDAEEGASAEVSLGVQRLGMVFGTAIFGAIIGLFFSVGFVLLHRAAPSWPVVWVALTVGALGFWSLSLFPFIKYPLNPPGVGDEATLLARQFGQTLFMLVSAAAIGVALDALRRINQNFAEFAARRKWYGGVLAAYGVLALLMVFVFPGNPDPVPVPIDLLELFRALTMAGQFLTWALLTAGVTLALLWHQRSETARTAGPATATGLAR